MTDREESPAGGSRETIIEGALRQVASELSAAVAALHDQAERLWLRSACSSEVPESPESPAR